MFKIGQQVRVREDFKDLIFNAYYSYQGKYLGNTAKPPDRIWLPKAMKRYAGTQGVITHCIPTGTFIIDGWHFLPNWLTPIQTLKEL